MEKKTIQHLNPVWREKADFIIGARCVDQALEGSFEGEQLWSRKISDHHFEICCIPFMVYDIALGDLVITDADFWVMEVKKRSGHFTFRVWFGDSTNPDIRDEIVKKVSGLKCIFEWYSDNLLALDAPSERLAKQVSAFLYQKEKLGELVYETGQT